METVLNVKAIMTISRTVFDRKECFTVYFSPFVNTDSTVFGVCRVSSLFTSSVNRLRCVCFLCSVFPCPGRQTVAINFYYT